MFVYYAAVITKLKWNVSDLCDSVHKLHALSSLLWVYLTKLGSLGDSGKLGRSVRFRHRRSCLVARGVSR